MSTLDILLTALAIDLFVGEWPAWLHPVVWMGRMQTLLRRLAPKSPPAAFVWGLFMALAGPLVFGGGSALLLHTIARWPLLHGLLAAFLLKSAFALRALLQVARDAALAIVSGDRGRIQLAMRCLVSRDTSRLPPELLSAATIESVAENLSDSLVAPLLFFLVLGVPGALSYRAANTLDAMIGYHGETEWLGKAAARLDDLLNLIPARLSALLLTVCAPLCGLSLAGAWRIWFRDSGATESPNAGRPMAAMAGALGVQLEKIGHYQLGAGLRMPGVIDIPLAVRLVAIASGIFVCGLLATIACQHAFPFVTP